MTSPVLKHVRTRLTCAVTEGYTVKPGVWTPQWCPFCGHRVERATHDLIATPADEPPRRSEVV